MTNRTFRSTLIRSLAKAIIIPTLLAAYYGPSEALGMNTPEKSDPLPTLSYADQLAVNEGLDCWKGEGPKGVLPTRAIVEVNANEGPKVVDSKVGFDIWLEGRPGTLFAFCR